MMDLEMSATDAAVATQLRVPVASLAFQQVTSEAWRSLLVRRQHNLRQLQGRQDNL
jgi:hypothetical protein